MDRLAEMIKENEYDWYVAITRGGMVPTLLLAQITGHRQIDTIVAKSYDFTHKSKVEITKKDIDHLIGEKVLLIDDLCDTGDTMRVVVDYLEAVGCIIDTMAVYKKRHSCYTPTYFLEEIGSEWVDFKYEKRQGIEEFIRER